MRGLRAGYAPSPVGHRLKRLRPAAPKRVPELGGFIAATCRRHVHGTDHPVAVYVGTAEGRTEGSHGLGVGAAAAGDVSFAALDPRPISGHRITCPWPFVARASHCSASSSENEYSWSGTPTPSFHPTQDRRWRSAVGPCPLVEPKALALGKAMDVLFVCTGHGAFARVAANPVWTVNGAPVRLSAQDVKSVPSTGGAPHADRADVSAEREQVLWRSDFSEAGEGGRDLLPSVGLQHHMRKT